MFEQIIQELIEEMEKRGIVAKAKSGEKTEEKSPTPAPPPDSERKEFKDVWSDSVNTIETDVEVEYDPDKKSYSIDGKEYKEGTAVWIPLEYDGDLGCNLDPDQPLGSGFQPELIPLNSYLRHQFGDIRVEFIPPKDEFGRKQRRLFPSEADFKYALKHCHEHSEPGFFIFCRDGKFNILCETHYYAEENDTDYLICIFNARPCRASYRKTWITLDLEIDATSLACSVRYIPGELVAWEEELLETLKEEAKGDWPFDDIDF